MIGLIVFSTIFEIFFVWTNIWKILAVSAINLWIIFLILNLDDQVNNRKIISSWWIFTSWVGIFSLFVALSYSLNFIGTYRYFNLTCDDLYNATNKLILTLSEPLKLSADTVNKIKQSLLKFKEAKVKDVIIWTWKDVINLSWTVLSWYETNWILGKIESLKYKFVDKLLTDKKSVDKWICQYMIDAIKKRYNKPWFKLSVLVLLTLLLWPFLRFALFIIWIINFVIFKILNLLKVYVFVTKVDEVEDIV